MQLKKQPTDLLNRFILTFFLTSFLGVGITVRAAEERVHLFAVMNKGDDLGHLKIIEKPTPAQTSYHYVMDMTTSVLFKKIHVQYNMDAVYKKGQLMNYHLIYRLNDRLVDDITLKWIGEKYSIVSQKGTNEHLKKIRYSTIRLFCKEPVNRSSVWGELICENSDLSKIEDGHYRVTFNSRKFNDYFYEKGQLIRASINTALMSFEMFRVN